MPSHNQENPLAVVQVFLNELRSKLTLESSEAEVRDKATQFYKHVFDNKNITINGQKVDRESDPNFFIEAIIFNWQIIANADDVGKLDEIKDSFSDDFLSKLFSNFLERKRKAILGETETKGTPQVEIIEKSEKDLITDSILALNDVSLYINNKLSDLNDHAHDQGNRNILVSPITTDLPNIYGYKGRLIDVFDKYITTSEYLVNELTGLDIPIKIKLTREQLSPIRDTYDKYLQIINMVDSPIEEELNKIDPEEVTQFDESDRTIKFDSEPGHPDPTTWRRYFMNNFVRLVNTCNFSENLTEPEKKDNIERLDNIFNFFLHETDRQTINFLASNSAMNAKLGAFLSFYLVFLKAGNERLGGGETIEKFEEKLKLAGMNEEKIKYWMRRLGSKAIEILNIGFVDDLGRGRAKVPSMSSDWDNLQKLESAKSDKEADDDFGTATYDFFMDPDTRYENKTNKKEVAVYQNARIMRVMLFISPLLFQKHKDIYGWAENDSKASRESYDSFNLKVINYLTLLFDLKITEGKIDELSVSNDSNILDELKTKKIDLEKKLIGFTDHIKNKKEKEFLKNFISTVFNDNILYKDGEIELTITKKESFYSRGKDENISINGKDIETLLKEGSLDAKIMEKTLGRILTSLGFGQHRFLSELSKGATPGGGLSGIYKRYMTIVCPFAPANYNTYKGIQFHWLSNYFSVRWNFEDDNLSKAGKKEGNANNVLFSWELTRKYSEVIAPLRPLKIDLGSINSGSQIESTYPTPYEFIVLGSRIREGRPVDFDSYITALGAFERFLDHAEGVPGKVDDKDKLEKIDTEESRRELREKLVADLEKLVKSLLSVLKANMDFIKFDHIAQIVMLYVDKIYRVYRVSDPSESGVKNLTEDLHIYFQKQANNVDAIGLTKFIPVQNDVITNELGEETDGKIYSIGEYNSGIRRYEVNPGLVAKYLHLMSLPDENGRKRKSKLDDIYSNYYHVDGRIIVNGLNKNREAYWNNEHKKMENSLKAEKNRKKQREIEEKYNKAYLEEYSKTELWLVKHAENKYFSKKTADKPIIGFEVENTPREKAFLGDELPHLGMFLEAQLPEIIRPPVPKFLKDKIIGVFAGKIKLTLKQALLDDYRNPISVYIARSKPYNKFAQMLNSPRSFSGIRKTEYLNEKVLRNFKKKMSHVYFGTPKEERTSDKK